MRASISVAATAASIVAITSAAPAQSTCPFQFVTPASLQTDATSTIYTATTTSLSTVDYGGCTTLVTVGGVRPLAVREIGQAPVIKHDLNTHTTNNVESAFSTEIGASEQQPIIEKRVKVPIPAWGPGDPRSRWSQAAALATPHPKAGKEKRVKVPQPPGGPGVPSRPLTTLPASSESGEGGEEAAEKEVQALIENCESIRAFFVSDGATGDEVMEECVEALGTW